jgi:hypothetical protein
LLAGRIFDDRGNRMTPSHAQKKGLRYRYYISAALLQGRTEQAGTVSRVSAKEIEDLVAESVRRHLGRPSGSDGRTIGPSAAQGDVAIVRDHVLRVEVRSDRLIVALTRATGADPDRGPDRIEVPWRKMPMTRHREILVPESMAAEAVKPIRSENRTLLVASIARGRRWLDELVNDPAATVESIAAREGCSVRKVNMTISLAFLAPDLIKAAIEGRLPHGMGVARLCDLPAEWSKQFRVLGLPSA